MRKIKVIHIHTDPKFVNAFQSYDKELFTNISIFLKTGKNVLMEGSSDSIEEIKLTRRSLAELVSRCNSFDIVILYGLEFYKRHIANSLSQSVKVLWRIFGAEVYNNYPELFLLKSSQAFSEKSSFLRLIKSGIRSIHNMVVYGNAGFVSFDKTIERINLLIITSEEEYYFLSSIMSKLPKFIISPFSRNLPNSKVFNKENQIFVGHSASLYNNHFEILDIIRNTQIKNSDLVFYFPLSYGDYNGKYKQSLLRSLKEVHNVIILEKFVSTEVYLNYFIDSKAYVSNSIRQIGLGNIHLALRNGVKVYLNPNNIVYKMMKNEGFIVFTVEDFKRDLDDDSLELSPNQAKENYITYLKCMQKYSVENFNNEIVDFYFNSELNSNV